MPAVTDVVEAIGRARLLPVIRTAGPDEALDQARLLAGAGHPVVEITATIPAWDEALRALRTERPDLLLGAGTITDPHSAERALDAGAAFLVSPWPVPDVRPVADRAGIAFIEGGFTPGELASATARGPAKLFPAHVGGLAYLRSLLSLLPGARIVPTGGIKLADVDAWLAAGAFAVGVGSDLSEGLG
jgi:2-dehydro-3-deoxyphosphogluconate aldolase/(4S)-4-hydroxy-2-oxoglutarate aldolase